MKHSIVLSFLLLISCPVFSSDLSSLSERDAAGGLKEVLMQCANHASLQLGKEDGFLANDQVRIGLPEGIDQAAPALREQGFAPDDLQIAMNRAAEVALLRARQLFIFTIKTMRVQDARRILPGGNDAATAWFKSASHDVLLEQFLPLVRQSTDKLQLAGQYNHLADKAASLGLARPTDVRVEQYVARKALDGFFLMMASKELAIRKDPLTATGMLAKKTFSLLDH